MYKIVNINYLIVLGSLCLIFSGCKYAPYRYSFSLVEPKSETRQNDVVGQALNFEDDNVQFRFVPSPENIWVVIRNKTDHKINLVRDKAEFIDHLGESSRVVYGHNFVSETRLFVSNNMYATPRRIDPGSEITGYVWINIGLDLSMMQSGRSDKLSDIYYSMRPFFPRYSHEGSGEDLKDSTFSLILPIDFDGHTSNYTFTFKINDVVE
jgi:hypothetical protein